MKLVRRSKEQVMAEIKKLMKDNRWEILKNAQLMNNLMEKQRTAKLTRNSLSLIYNTLVRESREVKKK